MKRYWKDGWAWFCAALTESTVRHVVVVHSGGTEQMWLYVTRDEMDGRLHSLWCGTIAPKWWTDGYVGSWSGEHGVCKLGDLEYYQCRALGLKAMRRGPKAIVRIPIGKLEALQ